MPGPGAAQRAASQFIIFENFKKMNTAEVRQGLSEAELAFVENLQPIAPNNWVTVPGQGNQLTTLGAAVNLLFYGTLTGPATNNVTKDVVIVFTMAGAGIGVDLATGLFTQFAPPGTFSLNPDVTSWQGERFLFNDAIAGYCAWDGTTFTRGGGVSANIVVTNGGVGYTSPPVVTISAPSTAGGVAATATAQIGTAGVTQVILDNPGSGYAAPPSIAFAPSGASATCTVDPRAILSVSSMDNPGAYAKDNVGPYDVTITFAGGGGSGASVQGQFAVNGLNQVVIYGLTNLVVGAGFSSFPSMVFTPNAHLTQITAAAAHVTAIGAGQVLGNPTVTAPGSYPSGSPPIVTFSAPGGGGTTATGHALVGGAQVISITLTSPGSGYLPTDTVTVTIGPNASFTASIAGTVMTVTGSPTGTILPGQAVQGVGVTPGTFITSNGSGSGGAGTYNISPSQTVASEAMTSGATAVARTAPVIPKGTSIAVFQGRVWMNYYVNGALTGLQWSGVGSSTVAAWNDWDPTHASGALVLADTDLVHQITGLRSFNNFLWIIGDQSIKQIGNISLAGSPNQITVFTILTLSSDQGTTFLKSCVSYNRVFFFLNPNGIYAVFGSSVQKVSNDLDGIFQNSVFPVQSKFTASITNAVMTVTAVSGANKPVAGATILNGAAPGTYIVSLGAVNPDGTGTYNIAPAQTVSSTTMLASSGQEPQAALLDMTNVHNVVWLLRYSDTVFTNTTRSLFVIFDGKQWYTGSQGNGIVAVTHTCTLTSPNWVPYASSGNDLTPVFNNINVAVNVNLLTALTHHQNPVQRKRSLRLGYAMTLDVGSAPITLTPQSDEGSTGMTITLNTGFQTRTLMNDPATGNGVNVSGTYLGFRMSGQLAGFTLTNLRMEYQEANIGNQN